MVKNSFMLFVATLIVLSVCLYGCSKEEGGDSDKGKIETMTDHAADVAVGKIRTPIDQAHSARDMEESRLREVDETVNE